MNDKKWKDKTMDERTITIQESVNHLDLIRNNITTEDYAFAVSLFMASATYRNSMNLMVKYHVMEEQAKSIQVESLIRRLDVLKHDFMRGMEQALGFYIEVPYQEVMKHTVCFVDSVFRELDEPVTNFEQALPDLIEVLSEETPYVVRNSEEACYLAVNCAYEISHEDSDMLMPYLEVVSVEPVSEDYSPSGAY